jgi:acyl carrier protein
MNAQEIRAMSAEVLASIAPEADLSTLADDEDLREALDLDSMDFLNFMVGMAERSGMKIPAEDAPKLRTLAGLEAYFAAARRGA